MRISVTPQAGPAIECDLFSYVERNKIAPDEVAVIVGDLYATGQHIAGNALIGFTTIERVREFT